MMTHRNETEDNWIGVDSNVHTNAEQSLYKPSIVQCKFLGQWKFRTEARSESLMQRQCHVWSSPFSPSVSTVDLVTMNLQANKHPPIVTSPHPVRPSTSSTDQKPCSALYICCRLLATDSAVNDHPLTKYLFIWPLHENWFPLLCRLIIFVVDT